MTGTELATLEPVESEHGHDHQHNNGDHDNVHVDSPSSVQIVYDPDSPDMATGNEHDHGKDNEMEMDPEDNDEHDDPLNNMVVVRPSKAPPTTPGMSMRTNISMKPILTQISTENDDKYDDDDDDDDHEEEDVLTKMRMDDGTTPISTSKEHRNSYSYRSSTNSLSRSMNENSGLLMNEKYKGTSLDVDSLIERYVDTLCDGVLMMR